MSGSRPDEPMYKGAGVRSWLTALEALYGAEVARSTLAGGEPALRELIEQKRLSASAWYPLAWYRSLHGVAQRVAGKGPALSREVGAEAMRNDLSGIYRIFLVVVSPQAIISKSARLFNSFFTHGSATVLESRAGASRVRWEGCEGFDRNLWEDVLGSSEASLALCGAKNIRIRYVEGGRDGDTSAELQVFWS